MSLLKMLLDSQNGQGMAQLAQQIGIDENQAGSLAGMLAPAIGKGARKQAESGNLDALLGQLKGESQASYYDAPEQAAAPEARAQGEDFLEGIFGSRDASQALSQRAAERTGVSPDLVSQFLPALAAMLQGGMQRQTPDSSISAMMGGQQQSGGGLMGMVGGLLGGAQDGAANPLGSLLQSLDADGDGSPLDDIVEQFTRR